MPTAHLIAVTLDRPLVARAREYASRQTVAPHLHDCDQLIYAVQGVMEVSTTEGWWLLPPNRALWMPAHTLHHMKARGAVSLRTLYLADSAYLEPPDRPTDVTSVVVTPLLTELIVRAVQYGAQAPCARAARLLAVICDEITYRENDPFHMKQARDGRLRKICGALQSNPADPRTLEDWAHLCGASSRTLARLFQAEFGSNYLTWRNQVCALHALARLSDGVPVARVADELGYESSTAFASMFKRIMGKSPSELLKTAQQGRGAQGSS